MIFKILLLMILCHVVDDFVLQPTCLSKLKQRKWWLDNGITDSLYENDYKVALLIHSMSWSIMIMLPLMFLTEVNTFSLMCMFFINTTVHYITDDCKANKLMINLITDQSIHMLQILITWCYLTINIIC